MNNDEVKCTKFQKLKRSLQNSTIKFDTFIQIEYAKISTFPDCENPGIVIGKI